MKLKITVAVLLSLCLGSLGVFLYQRNNSKKPLQQERTVDYSEIIESDDIDKTADFKNKPTLLIGDNSAPVTMTEYVDFKCPNCNKHHQNVGVRLQEEYVDSGKLKIEIRNYPFIGPDSGKAARGTYCAYDQGMLTSYVDNVFDYMWEKYYKDGDYAAEFEDILIVEALNRNPRSIELNLQS